MSASLILVIVAGSLLVIAAITALTRKRSEPIEAVDDSIIPEGLRQTGERMQTAANKRHASGRRYSGTRRHYRDRNGRALPEGYYFGDDGLLYDEFDYLIDLFYWYVILDAVWAEDLIGYPQDQLRDYNPDELMADVSEANEYVEEAEVVEESTEETRPVDVAPEPEPAQPEPEPVAVASDDDPFDRTSSAVDSAAEPDRITSNPAAPSYSPPPAPDPTPSYDDDSTRYSSGFGDSGGYDSGGSDFGGGGFDD